MRKDAVNKLPINSLIAANEHHATPGGCGDRKQTLEGPKTNKVRASPSKRCEWNDALRDFLTF